MVPARYHISRLGKRQTRSYMGFRATGFRKVGASGLRRRTIERSSETLRPLLLRSKHGNVGITFDLVNRLPAFHGFKSIPFSSPTFATTGFPFNGCSPCITMGVSDRNGAFKRDTYC